MKTLKLLPEWAAACIIIRDTPGCDAREVKETARGKLASLKELAQATPRSLTGCPPCYPLSYLTFFDSVGVTQQPG